MILVDLEQGSQEWLDFRKGKVGASDASVIMGINPWKTPRQLYDQYISGESTPVNAAMRRGTALEPAARDLFNIRMGKVFKPVVAVSESNEWQFASLDGMSDDGDIVEIKCGNAELHRQALEGIIPIYYMAQIQHQISVCNPRKAYYCSFDGKSIVVLEVNKDPHFIEDLLDKEFKYWQCMVNKEPPELSDRDYEVVESTRGSDLLQEYFSLCDQEKAAKERKDIIKKELIEIGPGKNFILSGTKIYLTQNSSYDLAGMKSNGLDIEPFKKYSTPYWMVQPSRSRAKAK